MDIKKNLYSGRIISIDAFRGITILAMIFVNKVAGVQGVPGWLKHVSADTDGMTFVDIVFPAFLFIVGMSVPFSFNARLKKGDEPIIIWKHTLKRTIALLVMGLFMVNCSYGYDRDAMLISMTLWGLLAYSLPIPIWNKYQKSISPVLKSTLQYGGILGYVVLHFLYVQEGTGNLGITIKWWGILGLIGWAYLITVCSYWVFNGNMVSLLACFALCVTVNTLDIAGLGDYPGLGWLGAVGGHFGHASIVMSGLIISLLFFDSVGSPTINWKVIGFCALLFVLGFLLRPYFEVSKIRATPSWCLYSAGWCAIAYYLFYWLMEQKNVKNWSSFVMPAAANPLLIYLLPGIFAYISSLLDLNIIPDYFHSGLPGILWSIVYSLLMMLAVSMFNKMNIRLHL